MIRSLRWRLQLWHALLLMTVLIIFGVVVYALQWQTRLQQTDAELDRVASVLTSRLRGLFPVPRMPGPGWPRNGRPNEDLPADALLPANVPPPRRSDGRSGNRSSRDGNRDERESLRDSGRSPRESRGGDAPNEPARDGSRDSNGRDSNGREVTGRDPGGRDFGSVDLGREPPVRDPNARNPWFAPPPGLGLPDEFKHLFDGDSEHSFYFIIWDRNGVILEKSKAVTEIPFPNLHTTDGVPVRVARMRAQSREVVHVTRFDINVLVGRPIQPDLDLLHRAGLRLILTGLVVLSIGLAGGWWFSTRAIRPIAEMSATAESISVKNLSSRINTESTSTELEQLATVLNRTFDRLQSAFERQGQFTADASHELRTPLAVIMSHAELALSRPRSSEEYQKAFQACQRASLRMKTLIDSLLQLARVDSGQAELHCQNIELDRVALDSLNMLQPLAEENSIRLSCQADPITISADQDRLFQLFTNLLTNAIRYTRPEGRVDLQVVSDDQFAIIRVSDTGVGIAAENLPRIFDRFYRVDKARTHAAGSGLGLAICLTIVEAHGGTITATSEVGVGTTIEVRLPKAVTRDNGAVSDPELVARAEPVSIGE
ncbi:MAG: HAMP domain-containing protein [Planctomycetes bacterium]|nr:HAMP domain-containing protein [Planctomycetota bacterium]